MLSLFALLWIIFNGFVIFGQALAERNKGNVRTLSNKKNKVAIDCTRRWILHHVVPHDDDLGERRHLGKVPDQGEQRLDAVVGEDDSRETSVQRRRAGMDGGVRYADLQLNRKRKIGVHEILTMRDLVTCGILVWRIGHVSFPYVQGS